MTVAVVFWDFGGVFTPSPFGAKAQSFAADHGLDTAALADLILGYHTPDGDHPWHRVERGEIPVTEAFAAVNAAIVDAGHDFHLRDFFKLMSSGSGDSFAPHARTDMVGVVEELAGANVRQAIITNNVREFGENWKSMLDLDLFDHIIDSCEVGVRKPDPAIYRLALDTMGVDDPSTTAFMDDFEPNVEAARALGINGIVVGDDPAPAITDLRTLTGL